MERLVLVTVLMVASTIASPVVDVSNKQSKIIRIKFNNLADKKYRATRVQKHIRYIFCTITYVISLRFSTSYRNKSWFKVFFMGGMS